jgi:NAD(P)-dependent dehydrogenase (short-subunit alcohol dehydrogenase family)
MPTVLVTGASSGIGGATAELFEQRGWNVVATMRSPTGLSTDNVLYERLDVQDEPSIATAVSRAIDRFGTIDAVVNNAGYGQYGPFEAIAPGKVREQFEVNVFGVLDVMRAVLPHLRSRRAGVVINVSSGAGLYALPLSSIYCASKYALEGFTESVAYELASVGIRVKLVIPHGGVTETNFAARSARDPSEPIRDYDAYEAQFAEAMARMPAPRSITARDVAATIFTAVTDETDRLRYLVGQDTRGFVRAWDTMSNDQYLRFMRDHFAASSS